MSTAELPDWALFRRALQANDSQAKYLHRLRSIEAWLEQTPTDATTALRDALHVDPSAREQTLRTYQGLIAVVRIKLRRQAEATPVAQQRLAEQLAVSDALTAEVQRDLDGNSQLAMPEEAFREVSRLNDRMSAITKASDPLRLTGEAVQEIQDLILAYEALETRYELKGSALDNLRWFRANAEFELGRLLSLLGKHEKAQGMWRCSAELYELAGDPRNAADCRARANEARLANDLDMRVDRDLLALTESAPSQSALDKIAALVDLTHQQNAAGDLFGAAESAQEARSRLVGLGFLDPLATGVEVALNSWIQLASGSLAGTEFVQRVLGIGQYYCSILGALVSANLKTAGDKSVAYEQVLHDLENMLFRIHSEWEQASVDIQRDLATYFPEQAAPPSSAPAIDLDWMKQMHAWDDALLCLREECNRRRSAGEPIGDMLEAADRLRLEARKYGSSLYEVKALLVRGYVAGHFSLGPETLAAAVDARDTLLAGRPAMLGSLPDSAQQSLYLEALSHELIAYQIAADHEKVYALCYATVEDFERLRQTVNAPFQDNTFFGEAVQFYRIGAIAAYKLERWDAMLRFMDLAKAHSAIRDFIAQSAQDGPTDDEQTLETELLQMPAADPRRRWLWDRIAIARRRSSGAATPEVDSTRLQAALAPDEALISYFWLNEHVLLVTLVDHKRIQAQRIVIKPEQRTRLVEFSIAIRSLFYGIDSEIEALGEILFPSFCRDFVTDKRRLIFSPNQVLHVFPFHAIPHEGSFLGVRFAVRYVPNFSSLLVPWRRRCEDRVLAIAVRDCGAPGFEVLPNVEREVEQVREFYQARGVAVDVLQGDDANRSTLERMRAEGRLSRYRYVHLGTHGESALAAPNAPLEAKLHLRLSHLDSMDIAMLGMQAEVVVLSACYSGQRAVVGRGSEAEPKDLGMDAGLPGDEIFGMQAALFQSGVHAVLGALWPVDVEPTATIIPEFHRGLSANLPAEVALQSAVARYLQTMQDPWLRKAVNWAPFFVSTMGGRIQGE
jgi:hypothetical protein